MGLSAAASCEAEDLDDSRVAVFEGNCFHFMSQEVKGPKSYTSFLEMAALLAKVQTILT